MTGGNKRYPCMCVCMYQCVSLYVCVNNNARARKCGILWTLASKFLCTYMYMLRVCFFLYMMCVQASVCVYGFMYVCVWVCNYVRMRACSACVHMYVRVCVCVIMSVCARGCACVLLYICEYVYMCVRKMIIDKRLRINNKMIRNK